MSNNNAIETSIATAISSRSKVSDFRTVIPVLSREIKAFGKSLAYNPAVDAAQEIGELVNYAWVDGARILEREYNSDLPQILSQPERDHVDNLHNLDSRERTMLDAPVYPNKPFGITVGEQIYRIFDAFSDPEAVDIELRNRPRKARGRIDQITRAKGIILVPDDLKDVSTDIRHERKGLETLVRVKTSTPENPEATRLDEIKAQYVASVRALVAKRREEGHTEEIDPVAPLETAMNNYRRSMRKDLGRRMKADLREIWSSAKDGTIRAVKLAAGVGLIAIGAAPVLAQYGIDITGWVPEVRGLNDVNPIVIASTVLGLALTAVGVAEAVVKFSTDAVQTVQIFRKIGYHKGAQLAEIRALRQELQDILPARKRRFALSNL